MDRGAIEWRAERRQRRLQPPTGPVNSFGMRSFAALRLARRMRKGGSHMIRALIGIAILIILVIIILSLVH
jgi:hypothetical protein